MVQKHTLESVKQYFKKDNSKCITIGKINTDL